MDRAGMGQMLMSEAKIEISQSRWKLAAELPALENAELRPEAVVEVLR
jgi:hypothetical protein